MKRTISKPHSVNHRLYLHLIILFAISLFISFRLPQNADGSPSSISQIIMNLSYGCIASTVVAWLIECANTRSDNIKSNNLYDTVYLDLKLQIGNFLDLWSHLCAVSFQDVDYYCESHIWNEWYLLTKDNFHKVEPSRQLALMPFFNNQLLASSKKVKESIERILSQQYYLTMNNAMNSTLYHILLDFRFEFTALDMSLSRNESNELFWRHMDAITNDLIKYINNWPDIQFYNTQPYKPFEFFDMLTAHLTKRGS